MSTQPSTSYLTPRDGYRLWASSYDKELNPMLALERRVLAPLLPMASGLDVVDLGCGTGRWLEILKTRRPHRLVGVDCSPEMLAIAREKTDGAAEYLEGDCNQLVYPPASADLILCNFLLSYIEDMPSFLGRIHRMLRPGGSVFLTDLHPCTVSALQWRRGVQAGGSFHEIQTHNRPVNEIIACCEREGLRIHACLEPHFGPAEREIFRRAGKEQSFSLASRHPAIYVLQVQPVRTPRSATELGESRDSIVTLRGARIALSPQESCSGETVLEEGCLAFLGNASKRICHEGNTRIDVDLRGFLLLPGLVNAHDHLEFALFPRLGKGGYRNFLEWAEDIHQPGRSPIAQHREVQRNVRLWWGGIRYLLCGVTTVCHHNPYEDVFGKEFAVRVLREFGWAHSVALDGDLAKKKRETLQGQPFIVHLAEGVDEASAEEIHTLQRAGALDETTVIVHGLGLGKKGRALLRNARAGLIWCPSSNTFLFGRTLSGKELESFPLLALGSDSPLTAQGDLLDEIRYAHEIVGIAANDLFTYVMEGAAQLLRLRHGEGTLRIGARADIVAVRDRGLSPAETLVTLSHRDVELVVIGGQVQLASEALIRRLPAGKVSGMLPLSMDGIVRWIRAPLHELFDETTPHLPGKIRLGGKLVSLGIES